MCMSENNKWLLNEYSHLCKYIRKKACSVQTIDITEADDTLTIDTGEEVGVAY